MASTQTCSAAVKRQRRPFSSTEKTMILNMYNTILEATPNASNNNILKTVASSMGIHWGSVFKIVKEKKTVGVLRSPKKEKPRRTVIEKTDSFTKSALRNTVHEFFRRNEIPTLDKILEAVNTDGTLGKFKRSSLHKLLRSIGFKFSKRSRNSMPKRRNDLRTIRNARQSEDMIYYLDETSVKDGKTRYNVWIDTTVQSVGSEFLNGLTTGLKNTSDIKVENCSYATQMEDKHIADMNNFISIEDKNKEIKIEDESVEDSIVKTEEDSIVKTEEDSIVKTEEDSIVKTDTLELEYEPIVESIVKTETLDSDFKEKDYLNKANNLIIEKELYEHHIIKEELVIGPVVIQETARHKNTSLLNKDSGDVMENEEETEKETRALLLGGRNRHGGSTSPDELFYKEPYCY